MKRNLHILLGLLLMLSSSVSAQNMLDATAAGFEDGALDLYWESQVKGTGTADYSMEQAATGTYSIKGINPGTSGNQMRYSTSLDKTLSFVAGKTYTFKYKRYLVDGADLTGGDKYYLSTGSTLNLKQVNNTSNLLDPGNNCNSFVNNPTDTWYEMEFEWTADIDYTNAYITLQVNPKAGTFYYDDFYIEEKAYVPTVTFNVNSAAAENIWVTLEQVTNKLASGTTEYVYGSLGDGTYNYTAFGKGIEPVFGSITVAGTDLDVTIPVVADAVNGENQLVLYSDYSSVGPDGKDNATKLLDRMATYCTLHKLDNLSGELNDANTIYKKNGTGYWIGNLNTNGLEAGNLYAFELIYNTGGAVPDVHPDKDNMPASLKPLVGFVNVATTQSANNLNMHRYLGYFGAHFIVVDESGDPINATVTIDGNDMVTGADGIGLMELEDDLSTYNYSVSATGYITKSGSVTQSDAAVTRDQLVNIELEDDGSTDVEDIKANSIYNLGSTLYLGVNTGDYKIYNLTGVLVQSGLAEDEVSLTLPKGIYIVKVGASTAKIKL